MAEVLLFHHAQGRTAGVVAFADELRDAGHAVHTPDLYEGRTFATLDDGLAYASEVGFDNLLDRGAGAADALPDELVYAGFSLGVMAAQKLAQTRAARGGAFFRVLPPCLGVRERLASGRAGADPRNGRRPVLRRWG